MVLKLSCSNPIQSISLEILDKMMEAVFLFHVLPGPDPKAES